MNAIRAFRNYHFDHIPFIVIGGDRRGIGVDRRLLFP
jgi:hypothetical protein